MSGCSWNVWRRGEMPKDEKGSLPLEFTSKRDVPAGAAIVGIAFIFLLRTSSGRLTLCVPVTHCPRVPLKAANPASVRNPKEPALPLIDSLRGAVDSFSRWPGMRGITDRQALETFIANRDQNLFYGIYDRWEDAEKAAASYGKSGYDNQESADLYRFMMRIAPHDYPA